MSTLRALTAGALLILVATGAATARETNAPPQGLPLCEAAFGKASSRFAAKERIHWNSGLAVTAAREVREIAVNPWGPYYIPRRFCTAIVAMNDGLERRMDYVVGAGTGLAGVGYGVEVCVSGADRNLAYAPDCKMVRP